MTAAKKIEARVKKLKEEASQFLSSEKYEKAVEVYVRLTKVDPSNGEWARRAADCHWHLKNGEQRIKYSLLAARAYSDSGLLLKAIAMCKVVLSVDPNHRETQEQLAKLHSRRPTAERRQPEGVKRHAGISPLAAIAAGRARLPARGNSLRPAAMEEGKSAEKNEERTRARMAAAAALRRARAQRRKEEIAAARERRNLSPGRARSDQEEASPKKTIKTAPSKESRIEQGAERVLGRIALKPTRRRPAPVVESKPGPPSSAFPDPIPPPIPSLRLDKPTSSRSGRALDELQLSQRMPAVTLESLPPARGNVYSLTLEDIPDGELRTDKLPTIAEPTPQLEPSLIVPVIPDKSETGRRYSPTLVDSIIPTNLGLHDDLQKDRSSLAEKDFRNIPLLGSLSPEVLSQLITDVAMVELETNEVLFHEGDNADAMYVVVEGSVTVVTLPYGETPIQLAHLEEGEFFGEIGLMSDQPRQATVSAHEPSRLLRFDRDIVAVLVDQDPSFLATLLQFLKDRLVEDLMMSSPLFAQLNDQQRYELADLFEFLEIEPNSILLEQGQLPIGMYVILTGEAQMKGASDAGTVRKLGSGDIFGEQALLNNEPSKVEVKTNTKSFALCLPGDAFPELVMTHPTVLEYLTTLNESSKGQLDVAEDFLDHIRFF